MPSPDLVPVPFKNGSFCRMQDGKLFVVVKNDGDAPAANKKTLTRVSWGQGGVYGTEEKLADTEKLAPGAEAAPLAFECPKECFAPDCMFYITVDMRNESGEDELKKFNNSQKGICFERDKPFLPDLVPDRFDNNSYFKRDGNKLKVKIKNQGTAFAGKSKTKIEFAGNPAATQTKNTKELDPGEPEELEFDIPADKQAGDFSIRITADFEDKVTESNEDNNKVQDRFVELDAAFL
ncbi:MAG: hypothetical protein MRJ67_09785 [Nitrospirales bacterium]|nr:hypothetical protein [Nitrospirales bacterium]